jgi:LytS/YehU family sensor histidine kinase
MNDLGIIHVLPPRPDPSRLGPPKTQFILRFVNNILISILVVGLNDAIKIFIQWMKDQHDMVILQRENARNELALLRQQISPHFFMNTLNNIHVLIDYDKEIAKDSVIKLAKLMRVLLYKEETKRFTLKKEIDFLNDYVELMRIRLNDKVDVHFSKPEFIPNVIFPPLLFINFVENAFKHGVRAVGDSFIHINFEVENDKLKVEISNSKVKLVENIESSGKVGLENSKKRLELLFKDKYSLDIVDSEEMFVVKIVIDI